nr:zinc finger BED domain-containing protein RICESLEEPER 2-like [Ipomoea batatas]
MSYASYNTVDQYSSPSVGFSDLPIDMAEGNEANVDLIGLECDAGKDVTKEVEEVEGDWEPLEATEILPVPTFTETLHVPTFTEPVSPNVAETTAPTSSIQERRNSPLLYTYQRRNRQDGLSEIKSIIENVRDSVKYISASPQRLHSFNEICKQLQVPSKKLILDCCTRWNATFAMLSCALDFKQVFPRYQLRDPNYNCLPSDDDWQRVEEICSLLVHFNEVTQIISGSEYPTSNLFLPELYNIKEILCQKAVSVEPCMKNMAQRMQQKFDKYWGSSNLLLSIAAVLDPRNKMTFIEFSFPVIYSEYEATRQIAIVRDSLYGLYKIYLDKYAATSKENDFQAMDTYENCVATTTWKGKGLVVETGRSKFEKFVRNVETVQNVKSELDTYLYDGMPDRGPQSALIYDKHAPNGQSCHNDNIHFQYGKIDIYADHGIQEAELVPNLFLPSSAPECDDGVITQPEKEVAAECENNCEADDEPIDDSDAEDSCDPFLSNDDDEVRAARKFGTQQAEEDIDGARNSPNDEDIHGAENTDNEEGIRLLCLRLL